MEYNMKLICGLSYFILLSIFITISGCIAEPSARVDDINVDVSWSDGWENEGGLHYDESAGLYISFINISVTSQREDLIWKSYDGDTGEMLGNVEGKEVYYVNNAEENIPVMLRSYRSPKEIEVWVIARYDAVYKQDAHFFKRYSFSEESNGVVRKTIQLPAREISYEITPDPLAFVVSKDAGRTQDNLQWIIITNTGDIDLYGGSLEFPQYLNEKHMNKPHYRTMEVIGHFDRDMPGNRNSIYLKPGESASCAIEVLIDVKTPIGIHETKGWLVDTKRGYRQSFVIKTKVI
jgi:hypothetical protein